MPDDVRAMLAVHARFTAHPGRGDELLAAVEDMFPAAEQEPDTLVYAAHRDRDDDDTVVMYELYRTDEAWDVHGDSDAAARFGAALEDLLAEEPRVWLSRPFRAEGLPLAY